MSIDYSNIKVGKQNRRDSQEREKHNRTNWVNSGQPPASSHKPYDLKKKKKYSDARKAKEYVYSE